MNNKKATAAKALIGITALSLVFYIGASLGQTTSKLQTTVKTNTDINTSFKPTVETRLVETHTVQYVEKSVTEVKYVERVERVPVELGSFNNLEELEQWLEETRNVTTIRFQSTDTIVDCDDYALELQQKALADGYLISFQIIEPDKYNSIFESGKLPPDTLHAINLVLIGNTAHYIEPQTGEIVFAAYLD
jgi:2-polyprenyl-6-methoxyphenol hydroxylase-like FAD-dependent oxidoreductase